MDGVGVEMSVQQAVSVKMRKRSVLGNSNSRVLLMMAIPCVILLIAFSYVPIFGWVYAFFKYQPGTSLFKSQFVGLTNFVKLFQSAEILPVIRNTLVFSFLGLALSPLPMIMAIVMSEFKWPRFQKFIQITTTFPNFISMVIVYSFCMSLFSVDDGIVNNLLMKLGLIHERFNILAQENAVYAFQTALGLWIGLGFGAIVYYAAIAGIDTELYDAAAVDGANFLQRMWHIKVPGLLPTYLVLFLLSIGSMLSNGFEQYYIFYNSLVHNRIQVLDLYVYKIGMERGNYSFSTAIGITKTAISVILLFTANFISKKAVGRSIL
jgi:putative aldouronate transport system permease protein